MSLLTDKQKEELQNSPFLDSDDNAEPVFSGSRWTKVIKNVN